MRINLIKTSYLLALLSLTSCGSVAESESQTYKYGSGAELCLNHEPIYAKYHEKNSDTVKILETIIRDFPVEVSLSHNPAQDVSKSVLITIEDSVGAHFLSYNHLEAIRDRLKLYQNDMVIEEYGLYKVGIIDKSALSSYEYFKVNPVSIDSAELNLEKLSDVYLGACVDGIHREGNCTIDYYYKGVILSYQIKQSAIRDWQIVVSSVNKKIDEWMDCKSK